MHWPTRKGFSCRMMVDRRHESKDGYQSRWDFYAKTFGGLNSAQFFTSKQRDGRLPRQLGMEKRNVEPDDENPRAKRRKLVDTSSPIPEDVKLQSSDDLLELLLFEQDAGPHVKQSEDRGLPSRRAR